MGVHRGLPTEYRTKTNFTCTRSRCFKRKILFTVRRECLVNTLKSMTFIDRSVAALQDPRVSS